MTLQVGDILPRGRAILEVKGSGLLVVDGAKDKAFVAKRLGSFKEHEQIIGYDEMIFCKDCGAAAETKQEKLPFVDMYSRLSESCRTKRLKSSQP